MVRVGAYVGRGPVLSSAVYIVVQTIFVRNAFLSATAIS